MLTIIFITHRISGIKKLLFSWEYINLLILFLWFSNTHNNFYFYLILTRFVLQNKQNSYYFKNDGYALLLVVHTYVADLPIQTAVLPYTIRTIIIIGYQLLVIHTYVADLPINPPCYLVVDQFFPTYGSRLKNGSQNIFNGFAVRKLITRDIS